MKGEIGNSTIIGDFNILIFNNGENNKAGGSIGKQKT